MLADPEDKKRLIDTDERITDAIARQIEKEDQKNKEAKED